MKIYIKCNSSDFKISYRGNYNLDNKLVSKDKFINDMKNFFARVLPDFGIYSVIISNAKLDMNITDTDVKGFNFEEDDRLGISFNISANGQKLNVSTEYVYVDDEFVNADDIYDRTDEAQEIGELLSGE